MARTTTVGIFAHVDAGKTTLSEQILYLSGARRSLGRVDHGDTAMDADPIERERGITIFTDQADFTWKGRAYTLIDTPGHVDFAAEAERALAALDVAVLLADASGGFKPHAAMLAGLARSRGLPLILFINKCDLPTADPATLMRAAGERLSMEPVPLPPEAEKVAELDEAFLDAYLAGDWTKSDCAEAFRRAFIAGRALPVLTGAALKGEGVEALLNAIDALARRDEPDETGFRAVVYKVRRDEKGRRVTFLRLLRGALKPRDAIWTGETEEKVQELRAYIGGRSSAVEIARAGDAIGALGLTAPKCGDVIEEKDGTNRVTRRSDYAVEPALAARVEALDGTNAQTLMEKLRLLEDEDPMLRVRPNPLTGELLVDVMGPIQLEILTGVLQNRFGIRASFGAPRVLYRETLLKTQMGYGHYEPLRHYAEVHLRMEPAPRGSGLSFASECHVDDLALNYQNLIKTHVFERVHRGVLTGAPLTDVRFVLTFGRAHLKHTEGGDFREATYRAIRQGLMSGACAVLEPFYRFELLIPTDAAGRVLSDIAKRSGTVESHETLGEAARIVGRGPVSEFADYAVELRAVTHGEGGASFRVEGYELCHDQPRVVEEAGYNAGADREQSPDSVFCSHGAGYNVPWYEAEGKMHGLK